MSTSGATGQSGQVSSPDKSLGELFSEMTSDLSSLVRKEVQLAKVETKEEISKAGKAGAQLGAGGFAGYMAVVLLSFALVYVLDNFLPLELAFLIVGAIYGIAAAVLLNKGKQDMKNVKPLPEQTVKTVKEDVEWARAQKN